jgi:hypothetical protein
LPSIRTGPLPIRDRNQSVAAGSKEHALQRERESEREREIEREMLTRRLQISTGNERADLKYCENKPHPF